MSQSNPANSPTTSSNSTPSTDSKKNEQKPDVAGSSKGTVDKDKKAAAPAVGINSELDLLAVTVGEQLQSLSDSSGLSISDLCSQLVARIRFSTRSVAAAPNRYSSGAQFQNPPR